ncbi:MAG: Wzz/FepE/Etk N-terminal domain-containing protein, partial [Sulfurimonas sp.]
MNNNQNQQIVCQEDEIDLRELFLTLKRNKKIIVIVTALITLAATLYVLLKTPVYEVKSNIRIGYIDGNLIEKPDILIKTLKIVFNVEEDKKNVDKNSTSKVSDVSSSKKLKDFIVVKTEGVSNKVALEKNKEVLSYIQTKYQTKIKNYKVNN